MELDGIRVTAPPKNGVPDINGQKIDRRVTALWRFLIGILHAISRRMR